MRTQHLQLALKFLRLPGELHHLPHAGMLILVLLAVVLRGAAGRVGGRRRLAVGRALARLLLAQLRDLVLLRLKHLLLLAVHLLPCLQHQQGFLEAPVQLQELLLLPGVDVLQLRAARLLAPNQLLQGPRRGVPSARGGLSLPSGATRATWGATFCGAGNGAKHFSEPAEPDLHRFRGFQVQLQDHLPLGVLQPQGAILDVDASELVERHRRSA
mmetsp:Transcript_58232/g.153350  ORF Transcript_58232/g.153350 Transcript_58232/m.153350 type:complete len:214 (+) Transcript_58232:154-795(+)